MERMSRWFVNKDRNVIVERAGIGSGAFGGVVGLDEVNFRGTSAMEVQFIMCRNSSTSVEKFFG
jgi:hypothetical protein